MKGKTVCFTGHRTVSKIERIKICFRLKKLLVELIEAGYCYFGAGGALGFDTIAAMTILSLRKKYPHIRLILVLPCKSQTKKWNEKDIQTYEYIKSLADKVVYTSEEYYNGCMQKRNRHLIDNSSVCICYLTKETGGTAYTVKYAKTQSVQIFNVAKKDCIFLRSKINV